jgi:hypothetical protein
MEYRASIGCRQEESTDMNQESIKPPVTYSEWVEVLDLLREKKDDRAVLQALQQGTIKWQSGVAERFAKKLIDSINIRMNLASDKFQRDFNNARGQEGLVVQALLTLRKEMSFLLQAINLPVIPEKDRSHYCGLVRKQADSMQTSLENSARNDRTGKMGSLVRNHKVNAF